MKTSEIEFLKMIKLTLNQSVNTMDSVLEDVMIVINNWLENSSSREFQVQKLTFLQSEIHRNFLQHEMEGDSVIDIDRLRFVSSLWYDMLGMLSKLPDSRPEIPLQTLQLFQAGEISLILANEIITKVM